MSEIRARAVAGLRPGDTFTISRTFDRVDTERFGELTRDYNPVHYEPAFAQAKGLAAPIQHGLLTGAMLCEIGGQMGWLASRIDLRFRRPVHAGDTISCQLTVTDVEADGRRERAHVVLRNQRGETVVEAELAGQLPSEPERIVMAELLKRGVSPGPRSRLEPFDG